MTYKLDKKLWTDADFEMMGWHDNLIYKISLKQDLELDIDYILKWNEPELEGLSFTFWIAPATLVFKNIKNLTLEVSMAFEEGFEIEDIERTKMQTGFLWTIITRQGHLQFSCDGYEQFIRQEPFFEFGQTVSFIKRFGHSLERTTNQENPIRVREDIIEQNKKDTELYELVKKRHIKKQEKEKLLEIRVKSQIDTKQYLLRKREIEELIFSYNHFLKGTKFESW